MKKDILLVGVLVLFGGWVLYRTIGHSPEAEVSPAPPADEPPDTTPLGADDEGDSPGVTDPTPPSRSRVPSPLDAVEWGISGRISDEDGIPVTGVAVLVLGSEDPFLLEGGDASAKRVSWNTYRGRSFTSGADGRWRAMLPDRTRVLVTLAESPAFDPVPVTWEGRRVVPPANDLDFVVRRYPVGRLDVRVIEAGGMALERFAIRVRADPGVVLRPASTSADDASSIVARGEAGLAEVDVRVAEPAGTRLTVRLVEPVTDEASASDGSATLAQELVLLPGETREVVLGFRGRSIVQGVVVDELGVPVPDALVFFGQETRLKGDELFRPRLIERVTDGVRTADDGWFELRGDEAWVTAVHPGRSSRTVRAQQAEWIELPPLGAIEGRYLDREGRPMAGALLLLDGLGDDPSLTKGASADALGAFRFENVEAGAHAIWVAPEDFLVGVQLDEGSDVRVEIRVDDRVEVELDFLPEPEDRSTLEGVVVGIDRVFGLSMLESGRLANSLQPGHYWLVTPPTSASFVVSPGESRATVEFGTAELRVASERPRYVQVVPTDAGAFLRSVAARLLVQTTRDEPALFRLSPGAYVLVGQYGTVLRQVELSADGTEVWLGE